MTAGVSHDAGVTVSTSESVGQNDLLIVGPGVLGRIVAEKWRQVGEVSSSLSGSPVIYKI